MDEGGSVCECLKKSDGETQSLAPTQPLFTAADTAAAVRGDLAVSLILAALLCVQGVLESSESQDV